MPFRWPSNTHRTNVVGATGTGKSVFGMHVLSLSNFEEQPWIIIDYKREELVNSIDRIKEIGLNELPKHPGIYKVTPHPEDESGVDRFLTRIWENGDTGLFFDEGHALPDKNGLKLIYTQGRALRIPCITCSQRPVWLSRYGFPNADFIAAFRLNDPKDEQTVGSYMPKGALKRSLPNYHSKWYDIGDNALYTMLPSPHPDDIAQRLMDKLKPRRKVY